MKGKLPTVKSGHDENGSEYKAFHSQMIQLVLKQPSPSAGSPPLRPQLTAGSPLRSPEPLWKVLARDTSCHPHRTGLTWLKTG